MSGEPRVRDYQPSDFPQVAAIWGETGMGGAERGDTAEVVERTLAGGGRLLVLEEGAGGPLIGTSWLTCDRRRLYLHHFAVRPGYQGRGLSRPLLRASLQVAKEGGYQIKLEVHRTNRRAIELYLKAGFTPLGDYDVLIVRDPSRLP